MIANPTTWLNITSWECLAWSHILYKNFFFRKCSASMKGKSGIPTLTGSQIEEENIAWTNDFPFGEGAKLMLKRANIPIFLWYKYEYDMQCKGQTESIELSFHAFHCWWGESERDPLATCLPFMAFLWLFDWWSITSTSFGFSPFFVNKKREKLEFEEEAAAEDREREKKKWDEKWILQALAVSFKGEGRTCSSSAHLCRYRQLFLSPHPV